MSERQDSHESRISRLEAAMTKMAEQVTDGFDRLERQIEAVVKRDMDSSRTQWGTLATWAGVILSVVVLIIAPVLWLSHDTRAQLRAHEQLKGHPEALIASAELKKDVERLDGDLEQIRNDLKEQDNVLQREMRLLDEASLDPVNVRLNHLEGNGG